MRDQLYYCLWCGRGPFLDNGLREHRCGLDDRMADPMTYEVSYLNIKDKFRTKNVTIEVEDPVLSLPDQLLRELRAMDPAAKRIWHYTPQPKREKPA